MRKFKKTIDGLSKVNAGLWILKVEQRSYRINKLYHKTLDLMCDVSHNMCLHLFAYYIVPCCVFGIHCIAVIESFYLAGCLN